MNSWKRLLLAVVISIDLILLYVFLPMLNTQIAGSSVPLPRLHSTYTSLVNFLHHWPLNRFIPIKLLTSISIWPCDMVRPTHSYLPMSGVRLNIATSAAHRLHYGGYWRRHYCGITNEKHLRVPHFGAYKPGVIFPLLSKVFFYFPYL